jgi:hypothetical protein
MMTRKICTSIRRLRHERVLRMRHWPLWQQSRSVRNQTVESSDLNYFYFRNDGESDTHKISGTRNCSSDFRRETISTDSRTTSGSLGWNGLGQNL